MKKKIIATVLGLAAITSLAACTPNVPATSEHPTEVPSETTTTPEPVVFYNVVLPSKVDGAYVSASTKSAKEGDEVVLTVVLTDSDTYQLDSVKLGDTKLEGKADENNANVLTYRFLMPAGDANIAVNTSKIVIPAKDHKISIAGSDKAVVAGLPSEANTGDTVTFKVSVVSGFTLDTVTATAGEAAVELTGDKLTGYSFTMPDADVVITAEVVGNLVKLAQNKDVITSGVSQTEVTTSDVIDRFIDADGGEFSATADSFFFRGGTKVRFVANHNSYATVPHFYVGGVEALQVPLAEDADLDKAEFVYEFTMPYEDVEIKADLKERLVPIKVNAIEGVTAEAYTMVEGAEGTEPVKTPIPAEGVKIGTEVYVSATNATPDSVIIQSVDYSYDKYTTETGVKTKEYVGGSTKWTSKSTYETFKYVDETTKKFTVGTGYYASDLSININCLTSQYAEAEWVGNYKGVEWYNHKEYSGNKSLNIDGFGRFVDPSSSYSRLNGFAQSVTDAGIIVKKDSDLRTAYYKDGLIAMSFQTDSSIANEGYYTDIYLMAKSDAQVFAKGYKGEGFDIVEMVLADNTCLGTFYIGYAEGNRRVIPGVAVEFTAGSHVFDTGAGFKVTNGTEVLAEVAAPDPVEPGEVLPFANKRYKAQYATTDSYGDTSSAMFIITFNADGTKLNFSGKDIDKYDQSFTDVAVTYDSSTGKITFSLTGDDSQEATFATDFTSLTMNSNLRSGYDFNFKAMNQVANEVENI